MRIQLIDDLRGLAMMYVILIHILFWFRPFGQMIFLGFFLIEMPLFFMVTGMANYFAHMDDLKRYYIARLQRLLVPYLGYSFIAALLSSSLSYYKDKWPTGGDNVLEIFSGWLNPFSTWPSLIPYLSWAMWFIPVYLIIMMILPVLKRCFFANSSFVRISPLILCPSLIILFQINNLGKYFLLWESVFYIFWVYIGFIFIQYVYGKSIQEKIKPCMICFICGSLSSVFLLAGGYANPDMQLNKFPPNGIFLCYTFTIMSIIILFIDQIHSVIRRIQRKVFCNGFFLFIVIAVIQFIYFIRLDF